MSFRKKSRPDTAPLRLIGLDSRFSDEQLEVLALDTDVLRVPAGDVLARVGEVARQFIAVADGYVEITDQSGHSSVGGSLTQIGATELLTGQQHRATVTTRSEATLVVIFGPAFKSAFTLSALASERGGARGTRAIARGARTDDAPTSSSHASVPALVD
jgi:CRP-like cAMP-binding protein